MTVQPPTSPSFSISASSASTTKDSTLSSASFLPRTVTQASAAPLREHSTDLIVVWFFFFFFFQTQQELNHCDWPCRQQSEAVEKVWVVGLLTCCHDSKSDCETAMATWRWRVWLLWCVSRKTHKHTHTNAKKKPSICYSVNVPLYL